MKWQFAVLDETITVYKDREEWDWISSPHDVRGEWEAAFRQWYDPDTHKALIRKSCLTVVSVQNAFDDWEHVKEVWAIWFPGDVPEFVRYGSFRSGSYDDEDLNFVEGLTAPCEGAILWDASHYVDSSFELRERCLPIEVPEFFLSGEFSYGVGEGMVWRRGPQGVYRVCRSEAMLDWFEGGFTADIPDGEWEVC